MALGTEANDAPSLGGGNSAPSPLSGSLPLAGTQSPNLSANVSTQAPINSASLSTQPVSIPTPSQNPTAPVGLTAITPQPAPTNPETPSQTNQTPSTQLNTPIPQAPTPSANTNPVAQANQQNTGLTTGQPQGLPTEGELQQNVNTSQTEYNQTQQQIQQLMQQLGYEQSDTTSLQNTLGTTQMSQNLADLNNQYAQAKAQYVQQYQNINAQNIPSLFVTGQEAVAKAAANANLGSLAAQVQAAQGNLTTAFNTIKQTISEKYDPITQQLSAQESFLKDNYDQLSAQQKILADQTQQTIDAQKANITNEQAIVKTAATTIEDATTKLGIDPGVAIKAIGDLASGTQTLDQIGATLGIAFNADGTSTTTGTGSGAGTGATNAAQALATTNPGLGALSNLATPLSTVITNYGIDNVVQAIISQEGGSLAGVENNPGNIKYYPGMANATNSGVAASDGGTFASFDSAADGTQAVKDLVQNAAQGTSTAYGQNPTFQDFMNKYTNTAPTSTSTTPSYQQYGLLANTDFNPNSKTDTYAQQYLTAYLKNGTLPTATTLGLSLRGGNVGNISGATILQNAQKRAGDLYYQATGQELPNLQILKTNNALVSTNNKLLNQLNVQTGTITKNFGLNLENLNANNVNQSMPIINNIVNALANATGSTSVAQYLSQNQTITNELASLLSVKNASGTTVADKLSSATILPEGASVAQATTILNTLMQEANNQQNTINQTNAGLYQTIDPLEQDPNNPNKQVTTPGGNQVPQMIQTLATQNKFDIDGAIKAGYSVSDIESYLNELQ